MHAGWVEVGARQARRRRRCVMMVEVGRRWVVEVQKTRLGDRRVLPGLRLRFLNSANVGIGLLVLATMKKDGK